MIISSFIFQKEKRILVNTVQSVLSQKYFDNYEFKALSKLPLEITAVCVGLPLDDGRTADSLRQEAREYGVSDCVQIIEKPAQEELWNYFQRAKVFCALSRKEGTFKK